MTDVVDRLEKLARSLDQSNPRLPRPEDIGAEILALKRIMRERSTACSGALKSPR